MKTIPSRAFVSLSALLLLIVSCQNAEAKTRNCIWAYKHDYVARSRHAAMATTGGRPYSAANISCGDAWSYSNVAQAKVEALRQCDVSNLKLHYEGTCSIIRAK